VPSTAFLVCHAFVEATGNGGRHDLEIVVGDAPVQPADLYALGPALLEDFDERLHGRDALAVVVEVWVDKVVLHVDDDEQSALRVDQNAAVVADAIVGVEGDLALAAARQIEAFGFRVVEPLVVAA
jgi:GTP:adenosylcobinamide-phosphate guanylyltransferase